MARIAILTNFREFSPSYSLTGIVLDQVRMLSEHGHDVSVAVNENYHGEPFDSILLRRIIPDYEQINYRSVADLTDEYRDIIVRTAAILIKELTDIDYVFTHDFVFTGWNLLMGLACQLTSKQIPDLRWLHWVHSVPSGSRDWWNIHNFPQGHRLIYPNETNRLRVAEQFRGTIDHVRVIPHIRDLRTYFDFSFETCEFIKEHPAVMQADIVQVYPAATDRFIAKKPHVVIEIFARLKEMGHTVCLVLANQHADTVDRREDLQRYMDLGAEHGLVIGKDLIATSLWNPPKHENGISKQMTRELSQCANLFIYPTREESFGLVLPEASLSGGCLCVLNQSLSMMQEISGSNAISFPFGSFENKYDPPRLDEFYTGIANVISERMDQNESIKTRTFMRQKYNYDRLYKRYYAPIMAESRTWQ